MSVSTSSATANSAQAIAIELREAHLSYLGSQVATLSGLNMFVPAGQWTCLLGRSGCGKTTLLRYLAGLLNDKVEWTGQLALTHARSLQGQVAYMAQQDLLLPWLNVLDNVLLSRKFDATEHSSIESQLQAERLLDSVGLADYQQAMPSQLSGGMRQRVALARTLMQDKPVVLMDEPFSALDAVTRYKLQNLSASLLKDKTVVLITHDPQEAVRLADQLYLLQGRPAHAQQLPVPSIEPPRVIDAECAELQQTILTQLEQDYE